ncbi:MAG: extracellular solute-binding protein [Chloroflexi bacterium]|nr:extracellular solute-binding protein [Chloroflexota bacterium]MQC26832.1 extracellular solute-binding protein [Chloroflexota bacterium]
MKAHAFNSRYSALVAPLFCGFLLLAACSGSNPILSAELTPTNEIPESNVNGEATPSAEAAGAAITLTLWIPPAFAPSGGDLEDAILQDRLDAFHVVHPNVQVQVRLKVEEGEGGMLAALQAANQAAPLAMPDLVLLPSDLLPAAAEQGLLIPLDGLLSESLGGDWFGFGTEMVERGGQTYGLPFAGDAFVLIHRLSAISDPPHTWNATLDEPLAIGFAAADPEALFTLHQLLAPIGGEAPSLLDESLDIERTQRLFNFYAEGRRTGAFPFWLTQYESPEQSWQVFLEGSVPMVANWSSRFLTSTDSNLGAVLLPSQDGSEFALARGWAWVISTPYSERTALIVALAEFLTDPEFMAQWSSAAGLLTTRTSALNAWSPDQRQALASQAALAAHMLPRPSLREVYGPAFSQAVVDLLKQETTAPEALQELLERLGVE